MFEKIKRNLFKFFKSSWNEESNTNISFVSNIEIPADEFSKTISDSKYDDTDCFRNIDLSREVGAFSPEYYRCNKHTRYLVLRAVYGEDKIPLIKILARTKKVRIRKKLIKRISK